MSKLTIALVMGVLLSFQLSAQAEQNHQNKMQEKLLEELALQPDQVDAVRGIMSEQHEQRRAVMEQMKQSMQTIHGETKQKLSGVLTTEQMQRYEELLAAHKMKMQEKREKWKERRQQPKDETSG